MNPAVTLAPSHTEYSVLVGDGQENIPLYDPSLYKPLKVLLEGLTRHFTDIPSWDKFKDRIVIEIDVSGLIALQKQALEAYPRMIAAKEKKYNHLGTFLIVFGIAMMILGRITLPNTAARTLPYTIGAVMIAGGVALVVRGKCVSRINSRCDQAVLRDLEPIIIFAQQQPSRKYTLESWFIQWKLFSEAPEREVITAVPGTL